MKIKRILSILVAAVLLLTTCCVAVSATVDHEIHCVFCSTPGNGTSFDSGVFTVVEEGEYDALSYNPETASATNSVATWGPYKNTLDAGCYRVDIEVAVTENNVADDELIFTFRTDADSEAVYVTKGMLAADTDGDGYDTYSHYFKLTELKNYTEYKIVAGADVAFKIQTMHTCNSNVQEYSAYEPMIFLSNAGKMNTADGRGVTKDSENGTATWDSSSGYQGDVLFGNNIKSLSAGNYRYEVDVELVDASVSPSAKLFNVKTSQNWGSYLTSSQSLLVRDIAGDNKICHYFSSETALANVECVINTSGSAVSFTLKDIRVYRIAEAKTNTAYLETYNPSSAGRIRHITADKADSSIGVYDPTVSAYDSSIGAESVWGPYLFNKTVGNYYRVDIEIALTGNNKATYITDDTIVFSFQASGTGTRKFVTVGELPSDTDGDGYSVYSFYYLANSTNHEYYLQAVGNVGFKIRNMYTYTSDAAEFNSFEATGNVTPTWFGNAGTKLNKNDASGIVKDTENGALIYDASLDNVTSGVSISGPYATIPAGNYRMEFDIKVRKSDEPNKISDTAKLFDFKLAKNYGAADITQSKTVYYSDVVDAGDGSYKLYFNNAEAADKVEFYFTTVNSVVDFELCEIRIYAVDKVVEDTKETPVWSGYAGENMSLNSTYVSANDEKAAVYAPVESAYNNMIYGPRITLSKGIYRFTAEIALTDANLMEEYNKYTNVLSLKIGSGSTMLLDKNITVGELSGKSPVTVDGNKYYDYKTVEYYIEVTDEAGLSSVEFWFATWSNEKIGFAVRDIALWTVDEMPKGDLDFDGKASASDLSLMHKLLLNTITSVRGNKDINNDGKFDIRDLVALKNICAENEENDESENEAVNEVYFTNLTTADTVFYTNTDCL